MQNGGMRRCKVFKGKTWIRGGNGNGKNMFSANVQRRAVLGLKGHFTVSMVSTRRDHLQGCTIERMASK